MLGRTDSRPRRRSCSSRSSSSSGRPASRALGYWQLGRHDWLVAQARDQVTVADRDPADRGTIYDRSGTVALATTISRDRLVAFPAPLAGDTPADRTRRARDRGDAGRDPRPRRRRRRRAPRAASTPARPTSSWPATSTTAQSSAVRAAIDGGRLPQVRLEAEAVRVYPLEGGAPKTTIAAHVLGFANREGDGQYGVEGRWQDALAGAPRVVLAERDASGRPNLEQAATLEAGSPGVDLTLTIDASLQLARGARGLRGLGGGPREERLGRGHGPRTPARSSPRPPTPPTTPTTTRAIADDEPRALPRPGRLGRLRAGLRLQDGHGGRRPRGRRREAHVHGAATRRSSASTAARRPSRNADRGSKGTADLPGRRGLVAQRRHVEGGAEAGPDRPGGGGGAPRDVGEAGLRRPDRAWTWPARCPASCATRRGRRGARSTSPTARSGRASR